MNVHKSMSLAGYFSDVRCGVGACDRRSGCDRCEHYVAPAEDAAIALQKAINDWPEVGARYCTQGMRLCIALVLARYGLLERVADAARGYVRGDSGASAREMEANYHSLEISIAALDEQTGGHEDGGNW